MPLIRPSDCLNWIGRIGLMLDVTGGYLMARSIGIHKRSATNNSDTEVIGGMEIKRTPGNLFISPVSLPTESQQTEWIYYAKFEKPTWATVGIWLIVAGFVGQFISTFK